MVTWKYRIEGGCPHMKLTVLGCLGAYPYKGEGTSSYLLESEGFHLLIDAAVRH